jgi:excinuclease ABC subunit A
MNSDNHSVIRIKGARQHNLDNLDVEIPQPPGGYYRLSGSGKSSLAFDTLYAEGQRKLAVESLSAYAPVSRRPDAEA